MMRRISLYHPEHVKSGCGCCSKTYASDVMIKISKSFAQPKNSVHTAVLHSSACGDSPALSTMDNNIKAFVREHRYSCFPGDDVTVVKEVKFNIVPASIVMLIIRNNKL
jgi:hypothetical protein